MRAIGLTLLLAFAPLAKPESPLEARLAAMERAIRSGEFKKITSVVVSRGGKIVYERYFEGDAATLRNTRSATKTITGMLVGIAIDRQTLTGVSAPVLPFFAGAKFQHPDPSKEKITVEDLLTMNSALDCNDWVDNSPGNEEGMYPQRDWVKFALDLPVRSTRGFSYCTAGVVTLGAVLERSAGMPVAEFARKNLFEPLGITSAKWNFSPSGQAMTGGGLELTTRDLVKLAQLYANRGSWNGKRFVSEGWVETSVRPHLRIDEHTEYGYLWWIGAFGAEPAYYMTGNGGNKVAVFPKLDAVVALTSTNYNTRGMHQQTEKLLTDYILPSIQVGQAVSPAHLLE
jgi:CubicO group peptidase (beta-lactamase class C family)